MSADRELLELAAKAAGYSAFHFEDAEWLELRYGYKEALYIGELVRYWNPLTDDGDAMRLAVKLEIDITTDIGTDGEKYQTASFERCGSYFDRYEARGDDPYAATRRAIVRAAAEIGRAMS